MKSHSQKTNTHKEQSFTQTNFETNTNKEHSFTQTKNHSHHFYSLNAKSLHNLQLSLPEPEHNLIV